MNLKIEDEDQELILLCSLLKSYANFIDTMLYGRTMITVNDVKDSLMSNELKRKVSVGEEVSSSVLFACRGTTSDIGRCNKGKSSSKSKSYITVITIRKRVTS